MKIGPIMRQEKDSAITSLPILQKIASAKLESLHRQSRWNCFTIWNLPIHSDRWEVRSLWKKTIHLKQVFSDRPWIPSQDCLFSIDSVLFDPECIWSKVFQLHPHLSKVFDHPSNAKAGKIKKVFASNYYPHSEISFLAAQSTTFISEEQYRSIHRKKIKNCISSSSYFFFKSLWNYQCWNWTYQ